MRMLECILSLLNLNDMKSSLFVSVSTVALNQTVGDWLGNKVRVLRAIELAKAEGARLIVCPEMCISGYSLGDRLLMQGTLRRAWRMLEELSHEITDCLAIVGFPFQFQDALYNATAVIGNGRIWGIVPKENLATGDVEYESRWYASWLSTRLETIHKSGQDIPIGGLVFEADGIGKFAIEVCEDGWKGIRPGSRYALAGAKILCNPSASWFTIGKQRIRRDMVRQTSREDMCAYVYTSLLGCDSTRLIFDGAAFIAQGGEILAEGNRFVFTEEVVVTVANIDVAGLERARLEMGSWRQQASQLHQGVYGTTPPVINIDGCFVENTVHYHQHQNQRDDSPSVYWRAPKEGGYDPSLEHLIGSHTGIGPLNAYHLPHIELELALSMALREYLKKAGVRKVALALSGGRDSTMCAVLLARMVTYQYPALNISERKQKMNDLLVTAYMGTNNSGSTTRDAAKALSEEIGAVHYDGHIQDAMDTHLKVFQEMTGIALTWEKPEHDIPLQNVQARLRGSLIWMVANIHNALLITTSNKSEVAVGYTTMDGDTSGGLAPIADVPKSLVIEWLDWAAQYHSYDALKMVTSIPSTAELRPQESEQTDEDDLMPFFILDQLMYWVIQMGLEPLEVCKRMWSEIERHREGVILYKTYTMSLLGQQIELFIKKLCFAQWKRERFAISFRVTSFDLDPKTGFRFPPIQAPFTVELEEMWEWIREHKR